MGATHLLHRAGILISNCLVTARGGARIMPAPLPFLLLLVAACALGMPERVRAADYTPSLYWDPLPPNAVPIGSQYGLGVYTADTFYTNGPGNDLSYSLNWPGGNSGMTPNHNSTCSGGFPRTRWALMT